MFQNKLKSYLSLTKSIARFSNFKRLASNLLTAKFRTLTLFLALSFLSSSLSAQDNIAPLFNQDSLILISNQFKFTEGASVDKSGNVYFTDQPNDKICKYTTSNKLEVFLSPSGRANGTMVDKKGNLIVCADEHNQLWSVDKNKNKTVLLKDYDDKKLNGPNDIWIDSKGGIYITDPYYQRNYWSRTMPDQKNESVYYLKKGAKKALLVADDLKQPNGIVGTPDGKTLYVSDIGDSKTYKYTISSAGKLTNRTLIINQGSDGMTLDSQGNIYLTGKGVSIFNSSGTKIGQIEIPESWTGNLCFGGKDKDVLFITASKSLYKIKMNAKGVE